MTNPISSIPASYTQLIILLEKAVALSAHFRGGYSNHFESAETFAEELVRNITQLKNG